MATELEKALQAAKQPDPADEPELMRNALKEIQQDLSWFFACAGHVSRDDMMMMIRDAQKRIDAVRPVVWPPDPNWTEPEPLDDNF